MVREIHFTDANWHVDNVKHSVFDTVAQYRYRGPRIAGRVEANRFMSASPLPDIPAPGQSIVFYKDDEMIGGGIITA
jgi:tRNA U34 2-thiouridine synthase MnmA/TrmU